MHKKPLKELVIAAQEGDRQAFAEIVARFKDNAHARAYHVLRDHQLAEDAVQEAFAEAFLNLDKLREPAAFPGWFKRVVIKRIDRLIRGKKLPMTSLETAHQTPATDIDPGEDLDAADTAATMQGVIDYLPDHERDVARQYYFEGKSQKEIADELGLPVTTIKKRLYASRQRLKKNLSDLQPLDAAAETSDEELPLKSQLFAAARHGFVTKAERILRQNPDLIHAQNEDGLTIQLYAAHAAHHSGNMRVVELLLSRGADVDLHLAAALGMAPEVDRILRDAPHLATQAGTWLRTPLHWAASGGHPGLAEWLLEHGADPNASDRFGCTPLHLAAELGRGSTLGLLLEGGADTNARLKNGKSVIHLAAQGRNPQIIRQLLNHGTDLDIFASASLGLKERVRQLLKDKPELVNARLPFGATPLHMAAEDGQREMAEYLVEEGAPVDLVCAAELGWTDDINRIMERDPETINKKGGSFGYTPLHSASTKGLRDLARLLIVRGAEVNATDDMFEKTPLGEALYYGNESMARLLFRHGGRS